MNLWHFLADATTQPSVGGNEPPIWANPMRLLPFIVGAALILLLFSGSRGKQKEQRAMAAMLKAMKRGDRVVTIGGIIGTVVDVRDLDVVVKVDEASNSKMRFERGAIKRIVSDDSDSSVK